MVSVASVVVSDVSDDGAVVLSEVSVVSSVVVCSEAVVSFVVVVRSVLVDDPVCFALQPQTWNTSNAARSAQLSFLFIMYVTSIDHGSIIAKRNKRNVTK